jgi:hypothetical protein
VYTFLAVLGASSGAVFLTTAAVGVHRGAFPFRPRRGWTEPPAGSRHSSPRRVSRADEPDLFWGIAAALLTAGGANTTMGVWFAYKLVTGAP